MWRNVSLPKGGLKLMVTIEVDPTDGMPVSKVDETKVALRELGMNEDLKTRPRE